MTDRLLQMFWHEVDTRTGSGRRFADRLHMTQRAGWTMSAIDVDKAYQPLGVDGGVRRSIMHMEALAELLRRARHPPDSCGLPMAVPAHSTTTAKAVRSRSGGSSARRHCTRFVDLFPVVFAEKDARRNWYEEMFISGDIHYSPEGNRVLYQAIAKELM